MSSIAIDTEWDREYQRTNQEAIDATAEVLAAGGPVFHWPISSQGTTKVTDWNPPNYPLFPGRHGDRHRKGRLY